MKAGRDVIVQFGLSGVPTGFYSSVARFISDYLGDATHPQPFGGREEEIVDLNAWLLDGTRPSNLLLTAPAGRGKSALLVHWIAQIDDRWEKIFLPISIRYGIHSPRIFYQALALRLQRLLDERQIFAPAYDQAEFYKEKCIEYMSELSSQPDKNILLVIDGLDEAFGWEIDHTLFPRQAHPTFKIVVSARWLAGEIEGKQWRYRLGWERRSDAEEISLQPLAQPKIAQLVAKCNLSESSDAVAAALSRISGGDPLMIGYLLKDVLENGTVPDFDITSSVSGFAAYFTAWVERQRPRWLEDAADTDGIIGPVMGTLGCALGPISNADLAAVTVLAFGSIAPITRQTLKPLQRFIFGDGSVGYSLAHPKLAEYFRNDYFQNGDVIRSIEKAFVQYGEAKLAEVKAAGTKSATITRYLLDYYAQHLSKEGATSQQFMGLVQNEWRLAWDQTAEREHGFFRDVATVFDAIAVIDGSLPQLFRCALCLTSVASLGMEIPLELSIASAKMGLLSWRKSLEYAKSQGTSEYVTAMNQLQDIIPKDKWPLVLDEAIHIVRQEVSTASKVRLMLDLSKHRHDIDRQKLIAEALDAAQREESDSEYLQVIAAILPFAQKSELRNLMLRALQRTRSLRQMFINPDHVKAKTLESLAPFFATEEIAAALDIARGLTPLGNRLTGTLALAASMPEGPFFEELKDIFSIAETEKDALICGDRHAIRRAIIEHNRIDLVSSIETDFVQAELIVAMAPAFACHDQAIQIAEGLNRPRFRASALIALLAHLTGDEHRLAVKKIFEILPLIARENVSDELENSIGAIVGSLSTEEIGKCFELSMAQDEHYVRARCLAKLAGHLTKAQLARALTNVMTIDDHYWCAHDLAEMSAHLSADIAPQARAQAIAQASRREGWSKRDSLIDISRHFPSDEVPMLWSSARELKDFDSRLRVFGALIPIFSAEMRAGPLSEVWNGLSEVSDTMTIATVIEYIAPFLSEHQIDSAIERIENVRDFLFQFARWKR